MSRLYDELERRNEALRLAVESMKPATVPGSTENVLARAREFDKFLRGDTDYAAAEPLAGEMQRPNAPHGDAPTGTGEGAGPVETPSRTRRDRRVAS